MSSKIPLVILLCFSSLSTLFLVAQQGGKEKERPDWPELKAERFSKGISEEDQALITEAIPESATAQPEQARRILLIDRCEGFVHHSIPFGNLAIERMGAQTGAFEVELYEDYSGFTSENLERFDAIVFNNTSDLAPGPSQQEAILNFVKSGKGIVGIHAASDSFRSWQEGQAMIGGCFLGHPWSSKGTWAFKLDDPQHPLNAAFSGNGFWYPDEIYWYQPETFQGRDRLRVLVSLDMGQPHNRAQITKPFTKQIRMDDYSELDVPVSWLQKVGEGRVFYTNFGHRNETFQNPVVLRHLLDGIQYALGDLKVDDRPSGKVEAVAPALAPQAAE